MSAASLKQGNELRVRNWLLATRPHSNQGTFIGYSSPIQPVPFIAEAAPAAKHSGQPRAWEGPGVYDGGSYEKYGELLEEWKTGRQAMHVEGGSWQEAYTLLHKEVMRGERETKLLEFWCEDLTVCGGLADRMLGMTTTFLLSLLTNRAFLASWDHPIPLSLLFDSPAIDWSELSFPALPSFPPEEGGRSAHVLYGNKTLVQGRKSVPFHNFRIEQVAPFLEKLRSGEQTGLANEPWIRLERPNRGIAINAFSNPTLLPEFTAVGLTTSNIYAQLVHYLFRPKLEAFMFIHEYTSLFALPSIFAVGIQIRTGDVYMRDPELDVVNTVERHQHWFDCANEVVETYALPSQRPLYFLITDSAHLRQSASLAFPDRVVVSGLAQHHNELRDDSNKLLRVTEDQGRARTVEEMKEELEGLQNTVAESWIFEAMDFALLSKNSGFGKIPTFVHGKPHRAISVPRVVVPDLAKAGDPEAYQRPSMPSCRLESALASFSDLSSGWSLG
ncbi:hypothetical protein JCM8547_004321 [Rhodosporidiobolus lusitaniae]